MHSSRQPWRTVFTPPSPSEASNSLQSYRDHKSGKYKDAPTLGAVRQIIYLNILHVKKKEERKDSRLIISVARN